MLGDDEDEEENEAKSAKLARVVLCAAVCGLELAAAGATALFSPNALWKSAKSSSPAGLPAGAAAVGAAGALDTETEKAGAAAGAGAGASSRSSRFTLTGATSGCLEPCDGGRSETTGLLLAREPDDALLGDRSCCADVSPPDDCFDAGFLRTCGLFEEAVSESSRSRKPVERSSRYPVERSSRKPEERSRSRKPKPPPFLEAVSSGASLSSGMPAELSARVSSSGGRCGIATASSTESTIVSIMPRSRPSSHESKSGRRGGSELPLPLPLPCGGRGALRLAPVELFPVVELPPFSFSSA